MVPRSLKNKDVLSFECEQTGGFRGDGQARAFFFGLGFGVLGLGFGV